MTIQYHQDHYVVHQAAATVSCEDRPNVAAEYMGRAGRLYVRIKKYVKKYDVIINNITKKYFKDDEKNTIRDGGSTAIDRIVF